MTVFPGFSASVDGMLSRAVQHHQSGQLREAEGLYRTILGITPTHPDANHNMGVLANQCGQPAAALPFLRAALKAQGRQWQFWVTYIETLAQLGDRDTARTALKQMRKHGFLKRDIEALGARLDMPTATDVDEIMGLFARGENDKGEARARDLVKRYPRHGFGWKAVALFLHRRGALAEALPTMQTAAKYWLDDAEIHYNLGVIEQELEHDDLAVPHYRRALEMQPDHIPARFNLGHVLLRLRQFDAAEACYRRVLALSPTHDGAYNNWASLLRYQADQQKTEKMYRRQLLLQPYHADAYSNVAVILQESGRQAEARWYCRAALVHKPDYVEALQNYGNGERELGDLLHAERLYRRSLAISPNSAEAANNLGFILLEQGQPEAAEAMFLRSLKMGMSEVEARYYAVSTLSEFGYHEQAEARYAQLMREDDGSTEARASLALPRTGKGRHDEGEEDLALSIERASQMMSAQSTLLFLLNYNVSRSAEEIFQVYRNFDDRMARPLRKTWRPHGNDRRPDRRLKVGYVSPDFRYHSTRMFLVPLLAHHDRDAVETYAFAELGRADAMTTQYQEMVDHWVPTRGMTDEELADRIRELEIDILVDVAGHTAGNRLAVFARKPAPVSVTWMGYNYTTGLTAIDYFLTDPICAPPGSEHLFAERPWRLDDLAFAFRPSEAVGEVSASPALARGYVTFGTLSRSVRINHRTIRVWAELMNRVEGARLVVNSANFKSSFARDALASKFAAYGIAADRLEMGYDSPPWDLFRSFDISLDCFPHCSGTTLFESLYMGLPFVTLLDRPSVGRLGAAILHTLRRPEWIAETEEEYIEKAAILASDLPRLADIRAGLRQEMQGSRVMDEIGTTRRIEAAYRQMWRNWCEAAQ